MVDTHRKSLMNPNMILLRKGKFTPRLVPTLGMIVLVTVLLSLCIWQISRHFDRNIHVEVMQKNQVLPVLKEAPTIKNSQELLYRRFHLQGHFVGLHFLEAGRSLSHQSGYAVFQIFECTNGVRLLIDRGDVLPLDRTPILNRLSSQVPQGIKGQLRPILNEGKKPPVNLGKPPLIWRRQSIADIHHWIKTKYSKLTPLAQVYMRLGQKYEKGKRPSQEKNDLLATGYMKAHINWDSAHYAVQWFGIAMIIFGFWLWSSFQPEGPEGIEPHKA
jgi:cytochrome oxidase assembly protein ShyY1